MAPFRNANPEMKLVGKSLSPPSHATSVEVLGIRFSRHFVDMSCRFRACGIALNGRQFTFKRHVVDNKSTCNRH